MSQDADWDPLVGHASHSKAQAENQRWQVLCYQSPETLEQSAREDLACRRSQHILIWLYRVVHWSYTALKYFEWCKCTWTCSWCLLLLRLLGGFRGGWWRCGASWTGAKTLCCCQCGGWWDWCWKRFKSPVWFWSDRSCETRKNNTMKQSDPDWTDTKIRGSLQRTLVEITTWNNTSLVTYF